MPARVSAGLAGRSRRLRGSGRGCCHASSVANAFVANKFLTNVFVGALREAATQARG